VRTLHLDDVAAPEVDGARWIPLRAELGIEAFGVGAYVGDSGEVVVPRHSEQKGGGAGGHDEQDHSEPEGDQHFQRLVHAGGFDAPRRNPRLASEVDV
jgi:hypothetical protein